MQKRFFALASILSLLLIIVASATPISAKSDKLNPDANQCDCPKLSPKNRAKKSKNKTRTSLSTIVARLDKIESGQKTTNGKIDTLITETQNNGQKQDATNNLLTEIRDTLRSFDLKPLKDIASWLPWIVAILVIMAVMAILNLLGRKKDSGRLSNIETHTENLTVAVEKYNKNNVENFIRLAEALVKSKQSDEQGSQQTTAQNPNQTTGLLPKKGKNKGGAKTN